MLHAGESGEQAIEKIKRDLWPTWKSGAMYWPILDFVTFRYIKIHLQVTNPGLQQAILCVRKDHGFQS
jgi:hypothetical protein